MMRSKYCPLWTPVSAYTVIILIGTSSCLNMVGVSVPELADLRLPVTLSCTYDTGRDAIFSVKWYKEDLEFYRYMPNHNPELLLFPLNGAKVQDNGNKCSNKNCTIVLEDLSPHASGIYTCEVSTEGPAFRTYSDSGNVTVAAPPLNEPELEGLKGSYSLGDTLDISCTTSPSFPAADVNLYINDEQIDEKSLLRSELPSDKLFSSSVKIQIVLAKKHFIGGIVLKVKCLSTVTSSPSWTKSIIGSASLGDAQLLHNQKLEWSNSADKIISSILLWLTTTLTLLTQLRCMKCM